jgi:hypothetical protein
MHPAKLQFGNHEFLETDGPADARTMILWSQNDYAVIIYLQWGKGKLLVSTDC